MRGGVGVSLQCSLRSWRIKGEGEGGGKSGGKKEQALPPALFFPPDFPPPSPFMRQLRRLLTTKLPCSSPIFLLGWFGSFALQNLQAFSNIGVCRFSDLPSQTHY